MMAHLGALIIYITLLCILLFNAEIVYTETAQGFVIGLDWIPNKTLPAD